MTGRRARHASPYTRTTPRPPPPSGLGRSSHGFRTPATGRSAAWGDPTEGLTTGTPRAMLNENSFHLTSMKATDSEPEILNKLRARGYKLTPQRRAVVRALAASDRHMTPAQLHAATSKERDDVGLVTVYRAIRMLAELDIVCEISTDGRQRSYLLRRPPEHHHHLVCSSCGHVVDFVSSDVERLQSRLARETGFRIDGHIVEFVGCCAQCRSIASPPGAVRRHRGVA